VSGGRGKQVGGARCNPCSTGQRVSVVPWDSFRDTGSLTWKGEGPGGEGLQWGDSGLLGAPPTTLGQREEGPFPRLPAKLHAYV
jgi:hypothetical protein